MTDILNFQIKDTILTDVISNNPYYIDIKGSVNICLIRCGQEIESCNDVYFSTMTNFGKILVLNPNTKKEVKCNIKLAYDTANDNISNNGSGNYVFERVFMTVPSLHQLNGQLYDMETFLVFSSVQKDGNVLYTCLCSFSSGTSNIPQSNDWKLLNYKLMNELLVKNNTVPDIHGTNSISGIPNPVDLSAFIPQEGSRSFYDYTHPKNTKVNFRVFQTPLSVSTEVISTLKSKLTPGNLYKNFKNAISKVINPLEGLFFYYSEDLTNIYKSYKANESNESKQSFNNTIDNENLEEDDEYEDGNNTYKKLDISKIEEEEEKSNLEKNVDAISNEDTFSNNDNKTNLSITYMIFLFAIFLISNYAGSHIITNIFTSQENLDDSNLKKTINSISTELITVLAIRFKIYLNLLLQCIFTVIIIIVLILSIINNNNSKSINNGLIIVFSILILLNGIFSIYLQLRYIFNRLKGVYDDDFSQKENYIINYLFKKIYKNGNIFTNLKNLLLNDNFNEVISGNTQSGGAEVLVDHAPGPTDNDYNNMKAADYKKTYSNQKLVSFHSIIALINTSYFRSKLSENPKWGKNIMVYLFYLIIFFVIVIILIIYYLYSKYDNTGVNILIKFLTFIFSFLPTIILPNILNSYFCYETNNFNKILKYIILGISCFGLLFYFISLFIPSFYSIIFIYISTAAVGISYAILLVLYFFRKKLEHLVTKIAGANKPTTESPSITMPISDITATAPILPGDISQQSTPINKNNNYILKLIEEKNNAIEKTKLLEEKINELESSKSSTIEDKPQSINSPNLKLQQNLQDERDKTYLLRKEIERLQNQIGTKDNIFNEVKPNFDTNLDSDEDGELSIDSKESINNKEENIKYKINNLKQKLKPILNNLKDKYKNILNYIISTLLNIQTINNDISKKEKIINIIDKLLNKNYNDYLKIENNISSLKEEQKYFNLINSIKNILKNIKDNLDNLTEI